MCKSARQYGFICQCNAENNESNTDMIQTDNTDVLDAVQDRELWQSWL